MTNPAWLRRLLLQHARHVLAVTPQDVADDVAQAASAALAAYGERADDGGAVDDEPAPTPGAPSAN